MLFAFDVRVVRRLRIARFAAETSGLSKGGVVFKGAVDSIQRVNRMAWGGGLVLGFEVSDFPLSGSQTLFDFAGAHLRSFRRDCNAVRRVAKLSRQA